MRILLHISVLLVVFSAYSQAPKYSNEFLSIGIGSRALAMANATVASVSDVSSSYWNPAGMVYMPKDYEIGLMHAEYFAGIGKFDYMGGSMRLDSAHALGITFIRFGVDDIPNTLDLYDSEGNISYNRIKYFSVADYAFLFSYARNMPVPGLSLGGNMKVIRRIIGEFAQAWGFGFDLASQYRINRWMIGATARDVTSTFNAWSFNEDLLRGPFAATGNEMPENSLELTLPRLIVGIAREVSLMKRLRLLAEMDADITFDGKRSDLIRSSFSSISPHGGFQLNYDNIAFFRAGIGNMQYVTGYDGQYYDFQPNIGVGVRFLNFILDYALTDIGDKSIALYSHVFSLNMSFNK